MNIVALTGGIGGAKLALGLTKVVSKDNLTFLVNVGDDFEHFGLYISPDIDTLTYTLSEKVNASTGWGRTNETWNCMQSIKELEGADWFQLGDRDLGLHLLRTDMLRNGCTLTQATHHISDLLGTPFSILPVTNDKLRTLVDTNNGLLSFQEYFVRDKCEPVVTNLYYDNAENALLNQELCRENIDAVIICPSNPFLSVDPLLAIPELNQLLTSRQFPVIAISPIIASQAVKGPTAKIMKELNLPVSVTQVAEHYRNYIDGFIIDHADSELESTVQEMGIKTCVTKTWMKTLDDKVALANDCLAFLEDFDF